MTGIVKGISNSHDKNLRLHILSRMFDIKGKYSHNLCNYNNNTSVFPNKTTSFTHEHG